MKPPLFTYYNPESLDDVLALLAENREEVKVLAGGQSLMPMLNMRLIRPQVIVDINRVPDLHFLELGDEGVRLGSTVRHRELERNAQLLLANPLLVEALPLIGHIAIRNRGTVCGSMVHADPAAELPAVALALDAEFYLRSKEDIRVVPASEFFVTYLTTAVHPDELLYEVRFPAWSASDLWSIREFARRQGDFALVGVIARLRMDNSVCEDPRIVAFGTGAVPQRIAVAEDVLRGERVDDAAIDRAVEVVRSSLTAEGDIHASADYRRYVAGTLLGRALREAVTRGDGSR